MIRCLGLWFASSWDCLWVAFLGCSAFMELHKVQGEMHTLHWIGFGFWSNTPGFSCICHVRVWG